MGKQPLRHRDFRSLRTELGPYAAGHASCPLPNPVHDRSKPLARPVRRAGTMWRAYGPRSSDGDRIVLRQVQDAGVLSKPRGNSPACSWLSWPCVFRQRTQEVVHKDLQTSKTREVFDWIRTKLGADRGIQTPRRLSSSGSDDYDGEQVERRNKTGRIYLRNPWSDAAENTVAVLPDGGRDVRGTHPFSFCGTSTEGYTMFFDSASPWRNRVSSALVGALGRGARRSRLRPRRRENRGLLGIDHLIERLEDRRLLDASPIVHPTFIIYNPGVGPLQSSISCRLLPRPRSRRPMASTRSWPRASPAMAAARPSPSWTPTTGRPRRPTCTTSTCNSASPRWTA